MTPIENQVDPAFDHALAGVQMRQAEQIEDGDREHDSGRPIAAVAGTVARIGQHPQWNGDQKEDAGVNAVAQ